MNYSNLVKTSLNDQLKFRLNEIRDSFNSEIKEKKAISKKLILLLLIMLTKSLLFCQHLLVL